MINIENDWKDFVDEQKQELYFKKLEDFLKQEYSLHECYPEKENLLNALNLVQYKDVRVVILGQDPYHQPCQANGLAFSVNDNVAFPKT